MYIYLIRSDKMRRCFWLKAMDVDALLSSEPCRRLEPEVRDFLRTSLKDAGDPAELLTPFLADAELADEAGTAALCRRFVATKATEAAERGPLADSGVQDIRCSIWILEDLMIYNERKIISI